MTCDSCRELVHELGNTSSADGPCQPTIGAQLDALQRAASAQRVELARIADAAEAIAAAMTRRHVPWPPGDRP